VTKIQEVKRKNGTVVLSLFLPLEVARESGLAKGDVVEVVNDGVGVLRIVKQ